MHRLTLRLLPLLLCLLLAACQAAPAATPAAAATAVTPVPTLTRPPTALPSATAARATAAPSAEITVPAVPTPIATAAPTANLPAPTEPPVEAPSPSPSPQAAPTEAATPTAAWPRITGIVIAPTDPPVMYALVGAMLCRSEDAGTTWVTEPLDGVAADATLCALAIDYRQPATMYLCTSAGIYRREGGRWAFVHTLVARSLAVDMIDSSVLWAGVVYSTEYGSLLLKSEDGGQTWARAGDGLYGGPVVQLLVDPANPETMYANTRYGGRFGWPEGYLFRGGRAGHWEPLRLGETFGPGACMALGIALDPKGHRLWVGCDAYYYNEARLVVMSSTNYDAPDSSQIAWETFTPFGDLAPGGYVGGMRPLAVDAQGVPALYVGRERGFSGGDGLPRQEVLVSRDQGVTWEALPIPALFR